MTGLADELLGYFNNTPKDIIKKEWKSIHEQFSFGIMADSYIEAVKETMSVNVTLHRSM